MRSYLIFALVLLCLSCNYKLFVLKTSIIHNQKGYILFYYGDKEALFFPWKDTVDAKFLSRNHADGYRISKVQKDLETLEKLATPNKIITRVLQNGQSNEVEELVKIIPVNIQYHYDKGWNTTNTKGKKNNLKYEYSNKEIDLYYWIYDNKNIMAITSTRRTDIDRVINYFDTSQGKD